MEGTIDFTGIEAAAEQVRIEPGTIAEVKVTEAEVKPSTNKGTMGLFLTFSTQDGAVHTEPFWLSPKALRRVQSAAKHIAGEELAGNLTYPQIAAKFKGRKCAGKFTAEPNDKGVYYTGMPFAGMLRPADKIEELSFTMKERNAIDAWKAQQNGSAPTSSADNDTAPDGGDASAEKW